MGSRDEKAEGLSPTGRVVAKTEIAVPGVRSVEGKIIALVDNHKPNFDIFLDVVEAHLLSDYRVAKVIRWRKNSPLPKDLPDYDKVAQGIDLALVGSCD